MGTPFELHPDLARDGVEVGHLRLSRLLLMKESRWPWLVLVPERAEMRDLHDLEPLDQYRVCDEITACSEVLKRLYAAQKINVAALGNMTPQLHIHVIARFSEDPAWPKPIWGALPMQPYPSAALEARVHELRQALNL
ncbi:HIT family protein [Aquibaculum sediminis]|uniref:HIT family protein n=1 Tax=Aquibaculum sediminis TaxID=3231907 RepID=UPI0034519045